MIIKQVLKPNVRATTKVLISGLIVSLATLFQVAEAEGEEVAAINQHPATLKP